MRLAIVLSHPTQYYSPWFRHLAARPELEVKVFYLWSFGVTETVDRSFNASFTWDIPLLDGYDYEFLQNRSRDPGTHHFRGLDNPGAVNALAKWRPDAVLMFGYNYATHLRLMLSLRLARLPFLFRGDSHVLCPSAGWKPKINRLLRSLIFRRFQRFLAVGEANAGYFRASGVPDWKIGLVPHCVDNDRFQVAAVQAEIDAAQWKRELGIPSGSTVVLFAGKFEEKKRPLDLLQAFLAIPKTSGLSPQLSAFSTSQLSGPNSPPASVLFFVGSGELESKLREAAGFALNQTVFFAPFQNQTAMPKVYATGDLLVLPSYGRGETWGLAVNEAMNLARPAIVSSHVGCGPDLLLAGKTGWIFPAGDVDSLRQTLADALGDPAGLRHMGERARIHIANYSYDRASDALLETLKEIG